MILTETSELGNVQLLNISVMLSRTEAPACFALNSNLFPQNKHSLTCSVFHCLLRKALKVFSRATWVAQRFSATFSPGPDPGGLGSSPTSGSLHGACFSLCLCLCRSLALSLCVSHE